MLQIGIIGLAGSGKTTIFNALCSAHASVGGYSAGRGPNVAVVKLFDLRLKRVGEIFNSAKLHYPEIEFIDIAGITAGEKHDQFREPAYVQAIRQSAALLLVVRCFLDDEVPHPSGSVNPARDLSLLEEELILLDLMQVESRIAKVEHLLKVRPSPEQKTEMVLMTKLKTHLEQERPLRELELSKDELSATSGFGFLTLKPALFALNIGENQLGQAAEISQTLFPTRRPKTDHVVLCAKLEMELASLAESERQEFMQELGLSEPALTRVVSKAFELLGLISFLTGNEKEARAWPIPAGATAYTAAGQVHSDIQRGFIKAETISFAELDAAGDWATARKHGKVRMEGKDYIVQDGDVILFRFNV